VVIVTFQRETCLLSTLEDLLCQDYRAYDITVIDQNEEPLDSVRRLASESDGRLRIAHLRPPNVCTARNVGIRATEGEIVLFVDDDIRCEPEFIAEHVAAYQDPEAGGVGGWINARTEQFTWKPAEPYVSAAIGCNMSFRRRALEQAGGFDPHFHSVPAYGEEMELAYRVRRAGYRIAVAPKAMVFHDLAPAGGQRARDPEQYWRSYTVNFVLLFRKTRPWWQQSAAAVAGAGRGGRFLGQCPRGVSLGTPNERARELLAGYAGAAMGVMSHNLSGRVRRGRLRESTRWDCLCHGLSSRTARHASAPFRAVARA
jgi:GT2 family glycosyltransferase